MAALFALTGVAQAQAQTPSCPYTPVNDPPTDKEVLITLYCSTNGDGWEKKTKWLSNKNINQWWGVNTFNSRVTKLYLNNNKLSGTMPTELGNLTKLVWFYLNTNNLNGTIPTELGTLTKVQNFALNNNQLSGTIPAELGSLTDLRDLFLNENNLSGTIPPELGTLTNLRYLLLNENNQLSGTIPAELGSLTNLKQLILRVNQLSGTIPPELGNLTKLERLYLYENQLSGSGIELEDMIRLQRLFIQNTMITPGTAMIEDMETLATTEGSLKGSGLWGSDDLTDAAKQTNSDLGRTIDWAALWAIYLDNDGAEWKNNSGWLAGSSLSNWYGVETNSDGRVEILNLRYNDLKEDIPNALEALKDITRLDLSYNGMLTGELSPRLMDISSLTELNIRCTGITKPTDLDFQSWLQTITLIDTQMGDACSVPPAVPVRMMTVTPQVGGLSVSWEESTDADGYNIQWKSGGQQFNATSRQRTVAGRSTVSYVITGLAGSTEYTVRVIATRSNADDGQPSQEDSATPITPPPLITPPSPPPPRTGNWDQRDAASRGTVGIVERGDECRRVQGPVEVRRAAI